MTSVAVRPRQARTARGDSAETAETGRLFEEYSGQLLAYCARQLGSRSEAEDAVQTTFLYVLRALRRGVVPECEIAWLTTIARNVCQWQRRTRARRGPLSSDIDLDTIALGRAGPDEEVLLTGLKEALESIPEPQRRAFVLREWHGVPPREIATELGISSTATSALLRRARRSLAQALTVPRRSALGVLGLGLELRSHVKALLGGASTKAAVAAAVVAGTGAGVGGLAVERGFGSETQPPPVSRAALDRGQSSAEVLSVRTSPRARPEAALGRAAKPTASLPLSRKRPSSVAIVRHEPARTRARVDTVRPQAQAVDPQAPPDTQPALATDVLSLSLLPALELPIDQLPLVEPPPLELPTLPPPAPLPSEDMPVPDLTLP